MSKAAKTPAPAKAAGRAAAKPSGPGKTSARESRLDVREARVHAPSPKRGRGASVKDASLELHEAPATLNGYIAYLRTATPLQRVAAEREGVPAQVVKHMATSMDVPAVRMFNILGVAKATAESKAAQQARIAGASGQAALGMLCLLAIVKDIVKESTDAATQDFDSAKWLGRWIEQPQAALGGQRPADLLDTPTGYSVVARLLGSLQSGAYQ